MLHTLRGHASPILQGALSTGRKRKAHVTPMNVVLNHNSSSTLRLIRSSDNLRATPCAHNGTG